MERDQFHYHKHQEDNPTVGNQVVKVPTLPIPTCTPDQAKHQVMSECLTMYRSQFSPILRFSYRLNMRLFGSGKR